MGLDVKGQQAPPQPSWLLRGADAAKAAHREAARSEARREEMDRLWRFWLMPGKEGTVTFLTGDLIADGDDAGMLNVPYIFEHEVWNLKPKGPSYFICPKETSGDDCPLCEIDNQFYYAAVLEVISHRSFTKRDGTVIEASKELFVCKQQVRAKLQMFAAKREGSLVGWTVDISRTDKKQARVGDVFDFQGKTELAELNTEYPDAEVLTAVDYGKELPFRDAAALAKILGQTPQPSTGSNGDPTTNDSGEDIPF